MRQWTKDKLHEALIDPFASWLVQCQSGSSWSTSCRTESWTATNVKWATGIGTPGCLRSPSQTHKKLCKIWSTNQGWSFIITDTFYFRTDITFNVRFSSALRNAHTDPSMSKKRHSNESSELAGDCVDPSLPDVCVIDVEPAALELWLRLLEASSVLASSSGNGGKDTGSKCVRISAMKSLSSDQASFLVDAPGMDKMSCTFLATPVLILGSHTLNRSRQDCLETRTPSDQAKHTDCKKVLARTVKKANKNLVALSNQSTHS